MPSAMNEEDISISTQEDLDELWWRAVCGRTTAIRNLHIYHHSQLSGVKRIPEEWPRFSSLVSLDIECHHLESFSVIEGSFLQLRRLKLSGSVQEKRRCPLIKCEFRDLESLRVLHLRIDKEVASSLRHSLQSCALLSSIVLDGNQMDSEASILFSALPSCPSLFCFYLCGSAIGLEGVRRLAEGLSGRPNLAQVSVRGCAIGDQETETLAVALRSCPSLTDLVLDENEITTLPDALRFLSGLIMLDVRWNKLTRIERELYDFIMELDTFYAESNPLEDPPIEVVHQGRDPLHLYWSMQRERPWEIFSARVMLIGETRQGKTTLCRSLRKGRPCSELTVEGFRHKVQIHEWQPSASARAKSGIPLSVKLLDFPGRDADRSTHCHFFYKRCVFVLVVRIYMEQWQVERATAHARMWLMSLFKTASQHPKILLVGTFFRQSDVSHNMDVLIRNLKEVKKKLAEAYLWNIERRSNAGSIETIGSSMSEEPSAHQSTVGDVISDCWVDCHSEGDSNLAVVIDKIVELSEAAILHQPCLPRMIAKFETHQELYRTRNTGAAFSHHLRKMLQQTGPSTHAVPRAAVSSV